MRQFGRRLRMGQGALSQLKFGACNSACSVSWVQLGTAILRPLVPSWQPRVGSGCSLSVPFGGALARQAPRRQPGFRPPLYSICLLFGAARPYIKPVPLAAAGCWRPSGNRGFDDFVQRFLWSVCGARHHLTSKKIAGRGLGGS